MAENIPVRTRRDPPRKPANVRALPAPPAHLSARTKRIWRDLVEQWVVGPEALPILRAGLEQLDTYDRAREQMHREGLTVTSKSGMVRAHPAAGIAKDALLAFRQCFRQLGLQPPEV